MPTTFISRTKSIALLVVGSALCAAAAGAQEIPTSPVGHPERVASLEPALEARTFSVVAVGDRTLMAFVQANDPHLRGAVRTALFRSLQNHAGLERIGEDRTLSTAGTAVALAWDGSHGAVVYAFPRPHRGEAPGTHRQHHGATALALADPLGSSALTAADIVLQRIDGNGAAVGRAVTVFEENSRAFRVAVVADGNDWIVAWTGAISVDGEIQGTVRSSHVTSAGAVRSFASDTGFTGHLGDGLHLVTPMHDHDSARIVWSGERCLAREQLPPLTEPTVDPSEAAGVRQGGMRFQHPPDEHPGPPIECGVTRLFAIDVHHDGTSSSLIEGPELITDSFAALPVASHPSSLLASILTNIGPNLARIEMSSQGFAPPQVMVPTPHRSIDSNHARTDSIEEVPSSVISPSRVSPPIPPDLQSIASAPLLLDAIIDHDQVVFAALSITHGRLVLGRSALQSNTPPAVMLLAPATTMFDIAVSGDSHAPPSLWVQTGTIVGGPVIYVDPTASNLPTATPESAWSGDERFRQHLLHARAARAAYTAVEGIFGPLSERPDAATNLRLPGLMGELRRLRSRWDSACEPLQERARFLVRHGIDGSIVELARQQCELPLDPVIPPPGSVPAP